MLSLHCALASCGAVYCNRSCLWVCVCVCLFVGLLPRLLEIACIDLHQTGFVGKGSDHLQLIKFWPSHAPRKGVCGGTKIFGSALLQPARSVCVSLSAFSYCIVFDVICWQSCQFLSLSLLSGFIIILLFIYLLILLYMICMCCHLA